MAGRAGTVAAPRPEVLRQPHRAVPLPPMDVAATDIRERVARGQAIDEWVPPVVARYIDHHALYRANTGS